MKSSCSRWLGWLRARRKYFSRIWPFDTVTLLPVGEMLGPFVRGAGNP